VAQFVQLLAFGVAKGSYYALIALGYTMVYGIVKLINFAHGEVFMLGAFIGLGVFNVGASTLGWEAGAFLPLAVCLLLAAVITPVIGLGLERFAYRPLRDAPRLAPLITALGASIALQQFVAVFVTRDFTRYPALFPDVSFEIFGASIRGLWVFMVGLSVVLMAALAAFIKRTRWGKAMRATAEDRDTARLMGVDVDRVIALTFIIGSALAGIGGVLAGLHTGQAHFAMGFIAGLKAFTAAVLGGIGNIAGAVLGAYLLGVVETFGAFYLGGRWQDVFAFAILILVLVLRPTGLLGERVAS
jgi:branched-chain amino acid transport system permease protein